MAQPPGPRPLSSSITVIPIETPTLGDRSYLVHDGQLAFLVDPQRDIDRVLQLLAEHALRLTHVFETHIHNDYLTGGLALSRRTGAAYLLNADDVVAFARHPLRDNETVAVGHRMQVTAIATPGHTFTHLAFVLKETTSDGAVPLGVFTGGSLLYGATGRPDLLGEQHTESLARRQHASVHRIADLLPNDVEVFPTHGFGSFCAVNHSEVTASTIGHERKANPALIHDEDNYVDELLAGLGEYPAYYAQMAPANAQGPDEPNLSPPSVAEPAELRRRIDAGEWVIDLRNRRLFAAGHMPGTFYFGLDGSLATYLGWLMDWGTPVTLLGETADEVAEGQRELVRIGIDRPAASSTGGPDRWSDRPLSSFPRATFGDLAQVRHHRAVTVLDVRRADEYRAACVEGAVNIPIHELRRRLHEVPSGELWVHCAHGYRASVAASFLETSGHRPVAVDDDFDNAAAAGLPVIGPAD